MLINVTLDSIERGHRVDCGRCPVAFALREVFGDGVSVGWDLININGSVIETPKVVRDFIHRFDLGHEVAPFSFILELDRMRKLEAKCPSTS